MQKTFGVPVVISNVPGAAGAVGLDVLARSAPDGYTVSWGGLGPTVLVHIVGPKPEYKQNQMIAFASAGTFHYVLVGRPNLPYKTISDIVAAAKSKPGSITYGTSGSGGPVQLAFAVLSHKAGISMTEVPYKGDPESLVDLMAGRIDLGMLSVPGAMANLKDGSIKALAIPSTSRLSFLPDVPTTAQSGMPDFQAEAGSMLLAPAGTPKPILAKLNAAVNAAIALPEMKKRYDDLGVVPDRVSVDEAAELIEKLTNTWKKIVADAQYPVGK